MTNRRIDEDAARAYPLHVLREYALLADGERGALVGPRGDIVWMCSPRWDSDAVFSSLIGGSGMYAITPAAPRFVWGGYYEDGSLIWRSRWITETGVIECREALAFPGEPDRAVLLRRIIATRGDAHVRVCLDARAGYGQHRLSDLEPRRRGVDRQNRPGCGCAGAAARRPDPPAARPAEHDAGHGPHPARQEATTTSFWSCPSGRCPASSLTQGRHGKALNSPGARVCREFAGTLAPHDTRHAYAVLRGLTSSGGGMVAAATMSLPERARQGRNYDYRYVWIRDQCFTGEAIAAAGPYPLLDDAVRFVSGRLLDDGPELLTPAYTTVGGRVPDQRSLHLPGYPGGQDIVGNHVNAQFQLDAFGESLLLLAAAARHGHLDADGWRAVETAAGCDRGPLAATRGRNMGTGR